MSDVREELSKCVQMLQKMTRWIHLMVPAIEDGNNFGVGVQGEILKMISDRSNHLNGLFAALPGCERPTTLSLPPARPIARLPCRPGPRPSIHADPDEGRTPHPVK